MFATSDLYALPDDSKMAFIKALLTLASIDGQVDVVESEFIQRVIENSGLSDEQVAQTRDVFITRPKLQEVLDPIKDPGSQRLLVQQLVLLAHIDGEYHRNERISVHAVAKHFGFSESWVKELEEWAEQGLKWLERGQELLGLEGE